MFDEASAESWFNKLFLSLLFQVLLDLGLSKLNDEPKWFDLRPMGQGIQQEALDTTKQQQQPKHYDPQQHQMYAVTTQPKSSKQMMRNNHHQHQQHHVLYNNNNRYGRYVY